MRGEKPSPEQREWFKKESKWGKQLGNMNDPTEIIERQHSSKGVMFGQR